MENIFEKQKYDNINNKKDETDKDKKIEKKLLQKKTSIEKDLIEEKSILENKILNIPSKTKKKTYKSNNTRSKTIFRVPRIDNNSSSLENLKKSKQLNKKLNQSDINSNEDLSIKIIKLEADLLNCKSLNQNLLNHNNELNEKLSNFENKAEKALNFENKTDKILNFENKIENNSYFENKEEKKS